MVTLPYQPFHELFPEIGLDETRTMTVVRRNQYGVPPDEYALLEMYCNDENCDCQRIYITVVSAKKKSPMAVLTYGWETKEFYAKWYFKDSSTELSELDDLDMEAVDDMHGIHLNLFSQQSKIAPNLMRMIFDLVLCDEDYVARIKRHYTMFRSKIDAQYRKEKTANAKPKSTTKKKKKK